jgi:hypothetical protein
MKQTSMSESDDGDADVPRAEGRDPRRRWSRDSYFVDRNDWIEIESDKYE